MEHHSRAIPVSSPPETASGPFVINLCASAAPVEFKATGLPGLERYRLYQVRRIEDSRPRYRLRLGFFADEAATEAVLQSVREFYPAAFSVQAGSDDLKHAPAFQPAKAPTAAPAAVHPAAAVPAPAAAPARPAAVASGKPAASAPHAPVAPAVEKAAAAKPSILELLPDPAPVPAAAPSTDAADTPFRVPVADPTLLQKTAGLRLDTGDAGPGRSPLPTIREPMVTDEPILIDSTQTLRLLTETELADSEGPQWFVVQLAVSEQPINLETMPKLDIFAAFRLYSIASSTTGRIEHSLRLGFFREMVSAEAVAGYLKTFFSAPSVLRVSAAEQTRFAEPPKPPVLNDARPNAKVVPLHDGRQRKPAPAPVLEAAAPAPVPAAAAQPAGATAAVRSAPAKPMAAKPVARSIQNKVPAGPARTAPASAVARKTSAPVGKRPAAARKRSLNELLHEEARQVELSESGIRRLEEKRSLLSRLVGKLTR